MRAFGNWTAATLILTLTALPALAADDPPVFRTSSGDTIPGTEVKMKSVDGRMVSIADVAGEKGTLVVFTCNACPWARAWEERIVALGNEYAAKGVGVIAINSNDPAVVPEDGYPQMKERAKDNGYEFPYVVDATSEVARGFGATRTPEAFVFNADGKLIYHGTIDDNPRDASEAKNNYLADALKAALADTLPNLQETRAMGCSIKFHKNG